MSTPNLTSDELADLSKTLDLYIHWAQVWHKQSGGYTASDTELVIYKMKKWADRLQTVTGKPEYPLRRG